MSPDDLVDVTSMHRPDTNWRFEDAAGHAFRWHDKRGPAEGYSPTGRYFVPGTRDVVDYEPGEDDDYPRRSHLECEACGARVEPAYTADVFRQMVPLSALGGPSLKIPS